MFIAPFDLVIITNKYIFLYSTITHTDLTCNQGDKGDKEFVVLFCFWQIMNVFCKLIMVKENHPYYF